MFLAIPVRNVDLSLTLGLALLRLGLFSSSGGLTFLLFDNLVFKLFLFELLVALVVLVLLDFNIFTLDDGLRRFLWLERRPHARLSGDGRISL